MDDRQSYYRERRAYLKNLGRCTECRGQDAYTLNGRSRCAECNARHNERQKQERERRTPEQCERERQRKKDWRRKRLNAGLCVRCGRKVDRKGSLCTRCLVRINGYAREHYREHHIGPRRGDEGVCFVCLKPEVVPGLKVCTACHEQLRVAAEKGRQNQNQNHPWRALNRVDVYGHLYRMGGKLRNGP